MSSILKGLYETKKDDKGFMPTPRQIPAPPGGHPVPPGYERVKSWGGAYELRKKTTEGEVVSMQARKTPLVLAGNPFDWDIYDLRTGKVVANLLGGDRHDSPLYEIRINRNGLAKDVQMKPTYVATGDVNGDGPHGIYELEVPSEVDKIEKSPGPGGTTKLRPDNMDMLGHMAKQTGQGKYYGYDLVHVADVDAYTWIEKVLGAKIMDVDDAMEAGYTDVDPEDPAGIIYTADQQNEGYRAGAVGGAGLGIDKSPMEKVLEKPLGEHINSPGGMGQSYRKFTPKSAGTNEGQLNELSPELLARYKKAAGADASKADKEGDFERGNKRFSGIVRATKKEFDKAVKEEQAPMFTPEDKIAGLNDPRSDGWRVYKAVPAGFKESAIMKGLQTERQVKEYELDSTRKIEFSKDNPPDLGYLYHQFIHRMLSSNNNINPNDWISKVNDNYGLNYTYKDYQNWAHRHDHTGGWDSFVKKYVLGK